MRLVILPCVVVALLTGNGCVPRVLQPSAKISRYELDNGALRGLRICKVQLGWTKEELFAACGMPESTVADVVRPPGECGVYRSLTHPTETGAGGVHWVAVCYHDLEVESGHWVKDGGGGAKAKYKKESRATSEVYDVHGLTEPPPGPPAAQQP